MGRRLTAFESQWSEAHHPVAHRKESLTGACLGEDGYRDPRIDHSPLYTRRRRPAMSTPRPVSGGDRKLVLPPASGGRPIRIPTPALGGLSLFSLLVAGRAAHIQSCVASSSYTK